MRKVLAVTAIVLTAGMAGCSSGTSKTQPTLPPIPTTSASPSGEPSAAATTASPTASASASSASPTASPTGSASASSSPSPSVSSTNTEAACTTDHLSITIGDGEGAAGTVGVQLDFVNTGPSTCTLNGFPGVSFVTGENGTQVGPAAARDGAAGQAEAISPKGELSALVTYANAQNLDAGTCKPTAVTGLRVYPPGEKAAAFVPMEATVCANAKANLRVRSIRPPDAN